MRLTGSDETRARISLGLLQAVRGRVARAGRGSRRAATAQILSTRSVNMIRYLLRSGTVKSPVTSR